MLAAVEIYNKPLFEYRDECVVILLLNGWELLLKATLSKNGKSIFYHKERKHSYRTLSWRDALASSEQFFPKEVHYLPVRRNLEMLGTYRDNAVHFYNAKGFSTLIYALTQTCIVNFRDYLSSVFGQCLENEISWQLLPIGIKPPVDVVNYISGKGALRNSSAVSQFLAELSRATEEVTNAGQDTGRLMTVFKVQLQSVKKIGDADVQVGVSARGEGIGPLTIVRTMDPNITHPLRQKDVVAAIETLGGNEFTSYMFQAIVWKHSLKENTQYCWKAKEGLLTRYSNDVVTYIKRLSANDVRTALTDYREHLRRRATAKKKA
jgi:hypothetical protein